MTYNERMQVPTPAELARLLQGVNVKHVARLAQVSTKTIYRYRWGTSTPTLETLSRLLPAIKEAQESA